MNIKKAVELLKPYVAVDTEASEALSYLEAEAMKQYQATGKQVYAVNKMLEDKGITLEEFIESEGIAVVNPKNLTKTEASALIQALKK